MTITKMQDEDGKGFSILVDPEDVQNVDPLTYFREINVSKNMVMYREMLRLKDPIKTAALSNEFFHRHAMERWEGLFVQIMTAKIPENFISTLGSASKGEQEKFLKNQSITSMGLGAFLIKAGADHGYTMSKFRTEHLAKNVDETKLPKLIHIQNDGSVKTVGYSPLTEGQLRNVITQRKVIVAHFLHKGNEWHCFFQTEKSMKGEEKWKEGQPHIHYLSDKWGVTLEDTIQRIKDGHYPSTSVHIALTDYGPQPSTGSEQNSTTA